MEYKYTYYGDLLGISGYYKLNSKIAYEKLNEFYNTTYSELSEYVNSREDTKVIMYSDSLLVYGDDAIGMLEKLHILYANLICKGLLLRGAMVNGRLEFEPRITIENFEKRLPNDDTIARAVGLESTHKGARLLIENNLAVNLLVNHQQWLTSEGYIRNVCQNHRTKDILRRICPTPNNSTYELLYFWICSNNSNRISTDYISKKKRTSEYIKILEE